MATMSSNPMLDQRFVKRKGIWATQTLRKSARTRNVKPNVHLYDVSSSSQNIVGVEKAVVKSPNVERPKRPKGRPSLLLPIERKQKKIKYEKERGRRKVFIGNEFERWWKVRLYLGHSTDQRMSNVVVAKALLDKWFSDNKEEMEEWEKESEQLRKEAALESERLRIEAALESERLRLLAARSKRSLQGPEVSSTNKKAVEDDCGQENEKDRVTEDDEDVENDLPVKNSKQTAKSKLVVKDPAKSSVESENESNNQQSSSQSSCENPPREATDEAVVSETPSAPPPPPPTPPLPPLLPPPLPPLLPPQESMEPDLGKVKEEILDDQNTSSEHLGQQNGIGVDNSNQDSLKSMQESVMPQSQKLSSFMPFLSKKVENTTSGNNKKFFIIQNQPSLHIGQSVGGQVPLMVRNVNTFIPVNNIAVSNPRMVNVATKTVGIGGVQNNRVILTPGNQPSVFPQRQFLLLPTQTSQQKILLTTQNVANNNNTSIPAAVNPSVMPVIDTSLKTSTPAQPNVNLVYGSSDNRLTQFVITNPVGGMNKNNNITPESVTQTAIKEEPMDTGYPSEASEILHSDKSSISSENVTESSEQQISDLKIEVESMPDYQGENSEDISLNMLCTEEEGTDCSQNVTRNKVIYTKCRALSKQRRVGGAAVDRTKSDKVMENYERTNDSNDSDEKEERDSDEFMNSHEDNFYVDDEKDVNGDRRHSARLKDKRRICYRKMYLGAYDGESSEGSKTDTNNSGDEDTRSENENTCNTEQFSENSFDPMTTQAQMKIYDKQKARKRKKLPLKNNQLDPESDMEGETTLEEGIKTEKEEEDLNREDEQEMKDEGSGDEYLPYKPQKNLNPVTVEKIDLSDPQHKDKYKMTTYTSNAMRYRRMKRELKSYRRYTCKLCEGDFNTTDKGYMEKHLTKHLRGELSCKDCGKAFSSVKHVMEHRLQKHGNVKQKYHCEVCGERFCHERPLQNHLANVHGQSPFKCRYCDETFKGYDQKKEHVYMAHPGMAVKCDRCHQIVMGTTAIKYHCEDLKCSIITDGKPNLVTCDLCGKQMASKRLKTHVRRVHLKVKNYRCKLCGFTASNATGHKHHMMTHTGERPWHCGECNFACIREDQLKAHMRTHTGLKPYRCKECSYATAWNAQLKSHSKAHVSDSKVDCKKCNITFKHFRGLNLHNKREHKDELPITLHYD